MTFPATHPALARALVAREYNTPTAVQTAVMDAKAATRDLLVSAQTGSGKTVAFGMAMALTLLGETERFERAAEPLALIIAPTRELALQVQRELDWLYAETGAKVITCVGGMDARAEARQLNYGAHIVVGTPGRLRDHLERKRLNLSKLKTIVLDEADEMLDLGFREDLEFILDATPAARQTLLFSATMPREIETLARRYQREAIRIETLRRDEQHADIEYHAIRVGPGDIENAVVNVLRLHEARATLVFCATREAVKRLHARLVERGFSAVALSGELTQNERTSALQSLRDGRARVLVATDVAARGLDLPDLALVIHADLPNDRETLLHRSGRTGRAGKKGLCVLIVPFTRRRKADMLLAAAKVRVNWIAPPTADEIRARDQERFLGDAVFTETPSEEDLTLTRTLQAARTADEIAMALVRLSRGRLPAPEDIAPDMGRPARREDRPYAARERAPSDRPYAARERGSAERPKFERPTTQHGSSERPPADRAAHERPKYERPERDVRATANGDSGERSYAPRAARAPRATGRDDARAMVWFRLNIGRERNADPRWLLPLICKAGNISKAEIGSIKIHDRDTRFEVLAEYADQFAETVRSSKQKEGHISRVGAHTASDDAAVNKAIDQLGASGSLADKAVAPDKSAAPAKPLPSYKTEPSKTEPSKFGAKAPWRDRTKPGANKPYESRAKATGYAGRSDGARDAAPKPPSSDAPRPASKFAHKKKPRPTVPVTS
jgi:ATP-dependent RNA helicase DeaD